MDEGVRLRGGRRVPEGQHPLSLRAPAGRAFWILLCGVLPLLTVYFAVAPALVGDAQAADFHYGYYYAAEAIRDGRDFYPTHGFVVRGPDDLIIDYVYPPLVALLTVPWTLIPVGVAESLFQFMLIGVFVATLFLLGVRDWRCYGLAFLWPPVTDAISTGNISILLGLAAALVWVHRDRPRTAGAVLGVSIAAKVFLWPLTLWLAVTRRVRAAAWSVAVAAVVLLSSWAVVGFRGLGDYPDLVRRLSDRQDERGYTIYALATDLGIPSGFAWALWFGAAVLVLVASVTFALRRDERRAYVLALTAAIALSPIVWLHYLSLALVAVAVAQPRLTAAWFIGIPLQVVVTTGVHNGSTFQTASVLVLIAVALVLSIAPSRWRLQRIGYAPARATTVISSSR
jgi:glycosyl transferase family 87